jgi:predicted flap endonuclease-1-like 5' DNA nuclease
MCILCILIPILVGLVCALLGYFLGRQIEKKSEVYTKLRADLDASRRENNKLLTEIGSLKDEIANLNKKGSKVKHNFDAAKAKGVFGKKILENDLTIIEGVGPKIAELFQKAGIGTWKDFSETTVEKCQQILEAEGEQFKAHKPTSWPLQAEMAYTGKWEELKKWQDDMLGGKL